jgi:hypothetical protein
LNNKTKNIKIAIIGSRGYPIVYSGYETFVKGDLAFFQVDESS